MVVMIRVVGMNLTVTSYQKNAREDQKMRNSPF